MKKQLFLLFFIAISVFAYSQITVTAGKHQYKFFKRQTRRDHDYYKNISIPYLLFYNWAIMFGLKRHQYLCSTCRKEKTIQFNMRIQKAQFSRLVVATF